MINELSIFSGIPKQIKRKLRPFARPVKNISSYLLPQNGNLIFVFSGRHGDWLNVGRNHYKLYKSYRNSVKESIELIGDDSKHPLLPIFEGPVDGFFDIPMNRHYIYNIVRVAMVDFFKDEGIQPDAVLGVSLGEIPALYAAEAISKKELYKIARSFPATINALQDSYLGILISKEFSELEELIQKKELNLYPVYELRDDQTIALVEKRGIKRTVEALNSMGISNRLSKNYVVRPYHTHLVNDSKIEALSFLRDIELNPLQCDFFSCTEKRKFERGIILDASHLFSFRVKPVKANTTIKLIEREEKHFHVLQIGPDMLQTEHLLKNLSKNRFKAKSFSSVTTDQKERRSLKDLALEIHSLPGIESKKNDQKPLQYTILKRYYEEDLNYTYNPYPYFNYLRKNGGIHQIPFTNDWIVLEYDEVKQIFQDPATFSNKPYSYLEELLLGADPPVHTRIRSLLQPLFSRKEFKKIEKEAHVMARDLLDQFPIGETSNFVSLLSNPLTRKLNARFLGLPDHVEGKLTRITVEQTQKETFFNEMLESLARLTEELTTDQAKGGLKFLLELSEAGEISKSDVAQLLRLLWLAGTTTTASIISSSVYRLLQHPEIAEKLLGDPRQIHAYLSECIRLEPPFTEIKRQTTKNVTISGVDIPAGTTLTISIPSANRDENVFPEPNRFILNRKGAMNLSFGSGVHYCIGMAIGRAEAVEVLKAVLERYDALSLPNEHRIEFNSEIELRAIKNLPVIYKPQ